MLLERNNRCSERETKGLLSAPSLAMVSCVSALTTELNSWSRAYFLVEWRSDGTELFSLRVAFRTVYVTKPQRKLGHEYGRNRKW
jgi:hypothetical protein